MNVVSLWQEALYTAWVDLITRLISFLPLFLSSLLIFIIGLIASDWLARLVERALKTLKLSHFTGELGIDKFLKKAEIKYDSVSLITLTVKWLIILIFFTAAVNILGLSAIVIVLDTFISYIPHILAGVLIIALGVFLARLVESLVKGALASVDHSFAKPLSQLAKWAVMTLAVLAGIRELRLAETLIDTFFQGLTWTITLAVGLAVGLGAKDLVASVLGDWYNQLKKK